MTPVFHLAMPVRNLEDTRFFYGEVLRCKEGRSAPRWVDYNFFGHQLSFHVVESYSPVVGRNPVDGDAIGVPHFGVVLPWDSWESLAQTLAEFRIAFDVEPTVRFAGQPGEQGTFFVRDPSGNLLEFKTFRDPSNLFAT